MIKLQTLSCPNCTAPLHPQEKQTLVACLYCNSTVRLSYTGQSQPAAATLPHISPDVVDEVKRLLILGLRVQAMAYYAQEARISEGDAAAAIATIHQSIAYAPPLSNAGFLIFVGLELISLIGLGAALIFFWRDAFYVGISLSVVAMVISLLNFLAFSRGLPGWWLTLRGQSAQAVIEKVWPIRSFAVRGQNAYLQRFLLEIHSPQQTSYQAEANGFVSDQSQPQFRPGSRLNIKISPDNPRHIVIIGPASLNE